MSITNALICGVMFYGLLVLLGRAIIILCRYQSDSLEINAMSPVIGLAVLTLLTTYLTFFNIPLILVSQPITAGLVIFAIIIMGLYKKHSSRKGIFKRMVYLLPLLITVLFIILPFIVGGYQFVILRGNGTDSFNYITMANALTKFPLDWILTQPKEILAAQSPSLPFAQDLLPARWSTSALLAFISNAFKISPVEFEYVFTLIVMVVLFNAFIAVLCAMRLLNKLTIWIPAVFIVGFWGQFILDIRAFSQICSLPILVILVGGLLSDIDHPGRIFRYGVALTVILSVALFFQYPEIIVAFLPCAGLIFIICLWKAYRKHRFTAKDIGSLAAFLCATFLLIIPIIQHLIKFALNQVRFAVNQSPGWENAYFSWMIKNPIQGLWGLGVKPGLGRYFDNIYIILAFLIAMTLTIGGIIYFIKILLSRQRLQDNFSELGLLLFGVSGFLGALLLIVRGNMWAAGKVISFFAILIPIWMAICLSKNKSKEAKSIFNTALIRIIKPAILGWGLMSLIFAGARIAHAVTGSDFRGYIMHHGEYRRVSADIFSKQLTSFCPIGSTVAVIDPRIWAQEFKVHLLEGKGYNVKLPGVGTIRTGGLPGTLESSFNINCVLAGDGQFTTAAQNQIYPSISSCPDPLIGIIGIKNDYGLEFDGKGRYIYLWNSINPIEIKLFADKKSKVNIEFELCPGLGRTEANPLFVYLGNDQKSILLTQRTLITVPYNVSKGVNVFKISITDSNNEPTYIGNDTRDLRLLIKILGIKQC